MRCNSESDYRQPSKYNYYDNNYNYFWSSDAYDANTARSIQLRAQTYAILAALEEDIIMEMIMIVGIMNIIIHMAQDLTIHI